MKLTTFIIMIALLQANATVVAQRVTLKETNKPLSWVLKEIKRQTGYVFFSNDFDPSQESLSVKVINVSLEEALQACFKRLAIKYMLIDKTIFLTKSSPSIDNRQPILVRGIVVDEKGQSIPGVGVKVKGSLISTSTDVNGSFSINVPDAGSILIVSYIGYETQEVSVTGDKNLSIMLKPSEKALEEVAVVGFGTQRKISLIGAQSTVNSTDLKIPVASVTQSLAGRIAGVVGVQRTGEPGRSAADIWVRGIATFGGGSSAPLILVDGVTRSISNIDPEDIESFTVLKDASGTAVYGARGANGVILVKTKTGKVGKPSIFFDYNEGISTFTRHPEPLDGVTYMKLANEALTGRGQAEKYAQTYIDATESGKDPLVFPNVNWMNELFKKHSNLRRANLNASGGVENAQYYVSLAYYNEGGFLKTDDLAAYNSAMTFNRYNFTSNLNLKITGTTKLDLGIQGYAANGNYPGETTESIFESALSVSPVEYPKLYPGGLVPGRSSNGGFRNPYADLTRRGYRTEFANQLFSNLRLTQDLNGLLKGLTATAMVAFDGTSTNSIKRSKRESTYFLRDVNNPYKADGSLDLITSYTSTATYLSYEPSRGGNRKFYTEAAINYDGTFGKHRVGGLVLGYSEDRTEPFAGNFTSSIPFRQIGVAARATYSFDDRYFAEANFGYNGSETFAPTKRYGSFPAFGVGWIPSNEKFWDPIKGTISFLKFRYSDGETGIGDIVGRRFAYLTLVSDGVTGYQLNKTFANINNGGINVSDYGIDVSWATSRKQDLGMEIRTLKDKLYLIVDLFKEYRTGIFLQRQSIPGYVGLTNQPFGNLGIVDNKGIDATLEYNASIGQVEVGLRGTFTYNKDKLVRDDRPEQPFPWMSRLGTNILSRYGYVAEKLFDNQAEIDASATPGSKASIRPGDIKYKDLNGDGLINDYDVSRIGRGDIPNIVYGFGVNISYKGFALSTFFQGVHGTDIMLGGSGIFPFNGGGGLSNAYNIATDRWTPSNPSQNVFYPRLAYGEADNTNNTLESSWWVKEANFLRLKTAQLSWNLPTKFAQRIKLKNAAIYMIGTNLLTLSGWKLWDPELNTGTRANGARYPQTSTISLGLNVKF
ncbi:SusC/RagA family TonB-linked outer membrane protein [Pedobacter sp. KBW06]|uniref:SusC/RagA family TonB-linked outer membrane protein n=1 Tax=Pedobacter sp. KBW06 TaxID=2153359 RepID=UPI0018F3ACE1|nr:TonB-dependent receptor [Pedobacter sp. KBW06]